MWTKGKRGSKACIDFTVPMVWREPRNHVDDCYFCLTKTQGYNAKNKKKISYPNLDSAIRPILHNDEVPVPVAPVSMNDIDLSDLDTSASSDAEAGTASDDEYMPSALIEPQLFTQIELKDLVRDLDLPKDVAELLGSRLQEKHLLGAETSFSWYRHREEEFVPFFATDSQLVYCTDISGLISTLGGGSLDYNASDWRLFIDSSKRSLKAVLLHNAGLYASVPIAHSVHLKESYENMQLLLEKINYVEHEFIVCGDLKVICMLLGQQSGYTKFPCFLCEWDSRARSQHWIQRDWPIRHNLTPGSKNILHEKLIEPGKVLLPLLYIKLGLMKQFVKALDKTGECFQYVCTKFPLLSHVKCKEGIFVGPQIRKLMTDDSFEARMTATEKEAWTSFRDVVANFLGNRKASNFLDLVNTMLEKFHNLGCNMSLKLHFLYSHLNYFPENLGKVSEEQGNDSIKISKRWKQDTKDGGMLQ